MARIMSYHEMRAVGLCPRCGKENPTPEYSMCSTCRERVKKNKKIAYEYRKRIHVCTRCGANKAEPNRMLCMECAGKEDDEYYRRERTDAERERDRERKRKQAETWKEAGLCPRCGKYPSINGGKCKKCRTYGKRYREAHSDKLSRSEWVSYGICYICGKNEVVPGKGVCQNCYAERLKTIPLMLEKQDSSYFRQLNSLVFMKNTENGLRKTR